MKVLVLAGDFVEDYELMVPFQALLAMGHQVDVVCPDRTAGETIRTAVHDFEGDQTYTEKPGHNFLLNQSFDAVEANDYDAVYVPGGRAPEYIRLNPKVISLVRDFHVAEKPIGAVCHGVQVLTAAGVIEGQTISAYPACQPDVEQAGATYAAVDMDAAVTSNHFVTGPAWPCHPAFLKQFVALF